MFDYSCLKSNVLQQKCSHRKRALGRQELAPSVREPHVSNLVCNSLHNQLVLGSHAMHCCIGRSKLYSSETYLNLRIESTKTRERASGKEKNGILTWGSVGSRWEKPPRIVGRTNGFVWYIGKTFGITKSVALFSCQFLLHRKKEGLKRLLSTLDAARKEERRALKKDDAVAVL
ncbi:uncharacterized protein FOMMEDRAFT_152184 [Fomitiporia mediterranea MF3/22]|uniref:uncharacterized protein n=1 Tax=Fomitiporia mediterranea (strain MF3/22) TaxID=694068 RepID=UPI00044076AD|nr:uncharacterized protein FOMMEDRAFT_152184 [Fomitiporia mediterranea MF3/22]EJD06862.1 hypothetical protein FOMMEDRAFT_152184 [Fomitiporia mediterranea MF3/22]